MKQWIRAALGLALAGCAAGALAQNTNSGDIRGIVTDASGAVVPGATVEVKDVDKGITHTYTTDGAGLYDTGSIVPDHYLITVTAPGFESYVRGPITLMVGTVTIDAALKIGAESQKVVVTTDLPLLQTESGAQSTTLQSQQLQTLPQVGGANWENFVTLLPGASSVHYRSGQAASINGNLPYSTVLADGATTTLPMSANSDVMVQETVSEVKVDTSAFSAQYGIGGTTFNQISKGGTNTFHGAAYEYFQNDAMNAAPYYFSTPATPTVPVLRYNNFGFSVSGPVLRNRVFFFFNYDKTINNGGATPYYTTVPTAAELGGDFTGLATIYDPTTQTLDSSGNVHRLSFAQEYGGNRIPASKIDPVAATMASYYPKANVAGTLKTDAAGNQYVTNNFLSAIPGKNPFTKFFGRLDWQINPTNHIILSETNSDNPAVYYNQGICPINCQYGDVSRDNAQVSWVWTISPQTINEARMGFTDQMNFFVPFSLNEGFPQKLGWKFAKADIFPTLNVYGNDGCCYYMQPSTNAVYKEMVFDPSDVVTLIRGKHVLHFGGEFLINRGDSTAWGNINGGNMNFSGQYTASSPKDTNTGIGFADFLLGYVQSWNAGVTPEYGGRLKSPQLFAQDDIKLRPNLTINLGLRWQGMTGWHEVKGNMRSFDPEVANPADGSMGAMWYGVTKAHGRDSLQAPAWNTFLPRVGFSYQPKPNTVVRGGFGLYGYSWSIDAYGYGMGNAFGHSGSLSDNTNGIDPVVLLDSDGNTNYQGPGGRSINSTYLAAPTTADALNGQSVNYEPYHSPVPKIMQWNFEIQQMVGSNLVMNAAYVASHAYDLLFPVDINQVPEAYLGPNDTAPGSNRRPYPLFQGINDGANGGGTDNGYSNYDSLQVGISKRMSQGIQIDANYTWSHMLDTLDSSSWGSSAGTQNYQNAYSPAANYGASNFDVRNAFKASGVYSLPFGHGRRFLNRNTFYDELLGGWDISPTVVWTTGSPFTPTMANNLSYSQAGVWFPNQVGNPQLAHPSIHQWFNTAAFIAPAPGTFGNMHRNILYGPNYSLINLAVGKTFHIYNRVNFELRGMAQNLPNHPSFGLPNTSINGGAGVITTTTTSARQMQLYGRFSF